MGFLLVVSSYLLGNVLAGSIISRLLYKQEIRTEGSGNPGARNVGRLHGKKAFVLTFIGDAAKGVLAVLTARLLNLGPEMELVVLLAATAGHIYPILSKFHGGKGVSTFIGGILLFNPFLCAVLVGGFLLLYPFVKSFTVAGLGAISVVPVSLLFGSYETHIAFIAFLLSGLVIFAHRENLQEKYCREKEPRP